MIRISTLSWLIVLLSCSVSDGATFRAGSAKQEITPQAGVLLDGPISKPGPVSGVHDRLHARALVLDDESTRLAIVICDACMIGRDVFDAAKRIVQQQSGLPVDRMLMAATHSHAAVRAVHIGKGPLDDAYHEFLSRQIAASIIQAQKNLAPAKIGWGSFDRPKLISCRRSLCEPGTVGPNPFGEIGERVASVSMKRTQAVEPAGPVDPQFSVLSVQHADGRPLALLGNFSVHYCGGYRTGMVSADYFGFFARSLEQRLNTDDARPPFVGIMSNGTSGNTGAIQSGGKRYPPFEWMQVSARMLADDALQVVERIEHRGDLTLDMREVELELAVRRPDQGRLAWADDVLNSGADTKHPHRWTPVYAREARHLAEFPATKSIKLQAIRIGELGITAMPCEVFAETGLAIKRNSPLKPTFNIELANGYGGYLPTPRQHRWGGYETWPARSSHLEVQAEPKIRNRVLELLNAVK